MAADMNTIKIGLSSRQQLLLLCQTVSVLRGCRNHQNERDFKLSAHRIATHREFMISSQTVPLLLWHRAMLIMSEPPPPVTAMALHVPDRDSESLPPMSGAVPPASIATDESVSRPAQPGPIGYKPEGLRPTVRPARARGTAASYV
eukprot:766914-Hanusia_phi.AAC.4